MQEIIFYLALISLLGSKSFKEREAAQLRLELSGKPVVPYLKMGIKSKDLEVSSIFPITGFPFCTAYPL